MRSPRERAAWTALAVLTVAGAVAAWWTAEQWLPHAGPWAEHAWRRATRPGPGTLPTPKRSAGAAGATPAPQPRKCVRDGHTIYTDQPCPAGGQEMPVDGAITTLPSPGLTGVGSRRGAPAKLIAA